MLITYTKYGIYKSYILTSMTTRFVFILFFKKAFTIKHFFSKIVSIYKKKKKKWGRYE